MALRIIKGGVIKGSDEPVTEERVGYKNPPKATRFKKGQSGLLLLLVRQILQQEQLVPEQKWQLILSKEK